MNFRKSVWMNFLLFSILVASVYSHFRVLDSLVYRRQHNPWSTMLWWKQKVSAMDMPAITWPIFVVDQTIPWNRSHNFHHAFINPLILMDLTVSISPANTRTKAEFNFVSSSKGVIVSMKTQLLHHRYYQNHLLSVCSFQQPYLQWIEPRSPSIPVGITREEI